METRLSLLYGGDLRNLLLSNRTFILQLAHPSVGAGVVQHSNFRQDPWHRLQEIAYSGNQMMFNGHEAAMAEGKRLREMHRSIKGINPRGERYHALNPDVYGWVHFVFYESNLTCHRLFGKPVPDAHAEMLFQNWRESGGYFGLREADLPATRQQYWQKWQHMMDTTLATNDAIEFILHLQSHLPDKPPPLQWLPDPVWRPLWSIIAKEGDLLTLGSLPPEFRQKLNLEWTPQQARQFNTMCRRIQRLFRTLPANWRLMPNARRRLNQIA